MTALASDRTAPKHPPHSQEAEQSVLGGLMLNNRAWDELAGLLGEEDFYTQDHRMIFGGIAGLLGAGRPCDFVTLSEYLRTRGLLEEAGGIAYLGTLAADTPSAANVQAYAAIVRERAVLRGLIAAGQDIAELGYCPDGRTPPTLIDQAETALGLLRHRGARQQGEAQLYRELVEQVERDAETAQRDGPQRGLETGITDFDRMSCGLQPGDVMVIAGRPGMGKTVWGLNIAEHAALERGIPVQFFSLEMPARQLAQRSMASRGRIRLSSLRSGELDEHEWARMAETGGLLRAAPLAIDDTGALSPLELRARARRHQRKHGTGLIVIDYIQLMSVPGTRENRTNEVSEISRSLKALAKELGVPVIALSQLSRGVEARVNKRPGLADLRECLPVEEWVDTPTGPVQLKTQPAAIISAIPAGAVVAGCSYIEKRYNSTYRVKTRFGSFSATAKHLVLTGVGWKAVRDLVPGRDVVACPKRIPHANRGYVPHGRLLGWLIGNGNFSGTPSLVYRCELDAAVREAVAMFGVAVRPRLVQRSSMVTEAYLSNGVETGCLTNPLMAWLRALGLEGKTAKDKFVPQQYLGSSDETHQELLRGLWEADGTVTGGQAKYTTCSETLARQVKWLLHAIGVRATASFYDNGLSGLWEVRCAIEDNERMEKVCVDRRRFGELSVPSWKYVDPAPAIFVELANELYSGEERFQKRGSGALKRMAKERMKKVLAECFISTIAESPYMTMLGMGWATVSSVEVSEREVRVCDLQVPGTHCFLTNGLVVHNSGGIEQDADLVVFIYRDEYYNRESPDRGVAEIIIAKQRNGPCGTVRAAFQGEVCRFDNLAPEYSAPAPPSWGFRRPVAPHYTDNK